MGGLCCTSLGEVKGHHSPIVNVEKVLADKAWDEFLHSLGRGRFVKREDYEIEVFMDCCRFDDVKRVINPRTSTLPGDTVMDQQGGESVASGVHQTSPGHIGLETEFNNDTDDKQTYTFQFEKVRTVSMNVTSERGFSIGRKANLSINLSSVLGNVGSTGLEMTRQLQVTKSTGENFEDSIKTTTSSSIEVPARSKYIARVVLEERKFSAEFRNLVQMSLPNKEVPVYIKDVKTGRVAFEWIMKNLPSLFKESMDKIPDAEGRIRQDAAQFLQEGIVDGVLSVHKISVYKADQSQASNFE